MEVARYFKVYCDLISTCSSKSDPLSEENWAKMTEKAKTNFIYICIQSLLFKNYLFGCTGS